MANSRVRSRFSEWLNTGLIVLTLVSGMAARAEEGWAEPAKVADVLSGKIAEANVAWWGFDEVDSTRFLQAALDSPATRVLIPAQADPWITEPLSILRDHLEVVFAQGVVLEAKKGAFRGRNDVLLKIWDRTGIVLRGYGATLRMHKQDYWEPPYVRSEWRNTLDIRGSRDVQVLGLSLCNSGGDGVYISSTKDLLYSQDIVLRDIVCDGHNRQGLSVISVENLLVGRCLFSNTIGTSPMAGVDFEPNNERQRLVNIVVRDCMFLDNSQLGLHVFLGGLRSESEPVSILCENNYIRGSEIGIHVASVSDNGPRGFIRFRKNVVEGTQHAGILLRRVSAKRDLQIAFEQNLLLNTARREPYSDEIVAFYSKYSKLKDPGLWWRPKCPSAPIVLTAQVASYGQQGGISFDGDLVIDDRNGPAIIVGGPWGAHKELFGPESTSASAPFQGWSGVSGTVRVINPHGAILDVQAPVETFTLKLNP